MLSFELVTPQTFLVFTNGSHAIAESLYNIARGQYEMCDYLYNSEVVRDHIDNYFKTVVVPHKQAVRDAGLALIANNIAFCRFLEEDDCTIGDFKSMLMVHDLSKFSAIEAIGYAFYSFSNADMNTTELRNNFDTAWLHHKHHNPHHPEYWLDVARNGKVTVREMPNRYIAEMVCDWIGAGKTYGTTLEDWLPKNFNSFLFHTKTKKKILHLLTCIGIDVLELTTL